jgi:hypothetical protein
MDADSDMTVLYDEICQMSRPGFSRLPRVTRGAGAGQTAEPPTREQAMHASVWAGLLAAAAVMVVGGITPARAQALARPVVVELFTSEGCSSCPPADKVLTELARARPDVLPLAFHVTYWDRLGWPDPFALAAATERQRDYAATLGLDSLYTPQMVVDGRTDVVGSDRGGVLEAVRSAATTGPAPVALRLARAGGQVTVEIGASPAGKGSLLLVGYDPEHRTRVARGENAGSTLTETNVVRGLARVADWRGAALTVQAAAPAGEQLAAILQAPDGRVLGAARLE